VPTGILPGMQGDQEVNYQRDYIGTNFKDISSNLENL